MERAAEEAHARAAAEEGDEDDRGSSALRDDEEGVADVSRRELLAPAGRPGLAHLGHIVAIGAVIAERRQRESHLLRRHVRDDVEHREISML